MDDGDGVLQEILEDAGADDSRTGDRADILDDPAALDYEVVGGDNKTMLIVSANGTAVKLG